MAGKIALHLRLRTNGDSADLREFLRGAIPVYERPKGIKIRLLRDINDTNRYLEIVEYETKQAYLLDQERVRSDPEMLSLLDQWRSLLSEKPELEIYEEIELFEQK